MQGASLRVSIFGSWEEYDPKWYHGKNVTPDVSHGKNVTPDVYHGKNVTPHVYHGKKVTPDGDHEGTYLLMDSM